MEGPGVERAIAIDMWKSSESGIALPEWVFRELYYDGFVEPVGTLSGVIWEATEKGRRAEGLKGFRYVLAPRP
jgi:hypothetical protein